MTFMAPDFSAFTQFLQELRMMQVTPQLAQPQQQQQQLLPQLGQSSQPLSPNNSSSMSSHHFSLGYSNQGGFIVEKPQTSINRASRVLTSRRYSQRLFTPSGLLAVESVYFCRPEPTGSATFFAASHLVHYVGIILLVPHNFKSWIRYRM
jgi:hypothetical protein